MNLRLSVLDQSRIDEGQGRAAALQHSVKLAQVTEQLGFTRYWVAEHHGSPSFAGAAPEILVASILGRTRNIRVGSGGVLLSRYAPPKVAEVFQTLAALHPGRVDLGVGRAGGPAGSYTQQVLELRQLLREDDSASPELWLLGAGTNSSTLAGRVGARFAFGHFLNPGPVTRALVEYR